MKWLTITPAATTLESINLESNDTDIIINVEEILQVTKNFDENFFHIKIKYRNNQGEIIISFEFEEERNETYQRMLDFFRT